MKSFSLACILFLALAGSAASEHGRWISLATDANEEAYMTKMALISVKFQADAGVDLMFIGGNAIGLPKSSFAKPLSKLAELYWLRERYSDAAYVYGQVLDLREKTLGPEHPELARDHNNFALILTAEGRHPEAEQHYKRAIEIATKAAGPNPDVAIIRNNYAKILRNQEFLVAHPSFSADFQKGLDAVRSGDFETALEELEPLAEQGHASAQYHLGVMYHEAEGVAQDYEEALKWHRKAAEQGHTLAQYNLGNMYENGRGVPPDYAEAAKWYRKAAEQGLAEAQHLLGHMYEKGQGVPRDYAEALKWYRQSADQGNAHAQYGIGYMYYYGREVSQDHGEAIRWFRAAAEQGYAAAQGKLAAYYVKSWGVMPPDLVQAYMWLTLSAAQGGEPSVIALALTEKRMTPAQVAEAKRLVREWRPKKEKLVIQFTEYASGAGTKEFLLPAHGSLILSTPKGWADNLRQPPRELPPTISFFQSSGERFVVLITPIWKVPTSTKKFGTSEFLRTFVESRANKLSSSSVETTIEVISMGGSSKGFYYSATDKAPKPGEYKYITQGAIYVGKLMTTFTILTNNKESAIVRLSLDMLQNAKHKP